MKLKLLVLAAALLLGTLVVANVAFAGRTHCYIIDGKMICCNTTGNMTNCF